METQCHEIGTIGLGVMGRNLLLNMPANLIQAQRDYFGTHSYERVDVKSAFHTDWTKG